MTSRLINGITSLDVFMTTYRDRQPVVLQGQITHWPALQRWTPDYLAQRFGDIDVVVAYYDPTSTETFQSQTLTDVHTRMPLRTLLAGLAIGDHRYALREDTSLFERAPSLLRDLSYLAPFVRSADATTTYRSLWIGPPAYITGLHTDPGDTLLIQLYGRKDVQLFGPDQSRYLYEEPSGPQNPAFQHSPLSQRLDTAFLHVLRDKVRWSAVQPFRSDLERFPLFARANGVHARLHPGDTLYIPDRWWHSIRALDAAISISLEPDFLARDL